MNYKTLVRQLNKQLIGEDISSHEFCFGHTVNQTVDGRVFVDQRITEYASLDEARNIIKQQTIREQLQAEIQQEQYDELSNNKIAAIIREHHGNIKVTDTLIESYIDLASSKLFTVDPVATDIRKLNKLDCLVDNKLDYQLDDGTIIAIDEQTHTAINNTFGSHPDVIEYMRKNITTFTNVVNELRD